MSDPEPLRFAGTDEDLELDFPEDDDTEVTIGADDLDQADRWLRGMRAVMRRRDRFLTVANRRRAELDARVAEVVGPMDDSIARLELALAQFHAAVLTRDPLATTVKLPHGELSTRGAGVDWVVEDEEAFRTWLKNNRPALLVAQEAPEAQLDRNGMKAAFAEGAVISPKKGGQRPLDDEGKVVDPKTGEVVPGLKIVAKERKYVPKPSEVS